MAVDTTTAALRQQQLVEHNYHQPELFSEKRLFSIVNIPSSITMVSLAQVLVTLLLLMLVVPNAVSANSNFSPCGKRCILDRKTGKWICKPVVCRPCYACIYRERCRVRLLGFKCCGRVGFCFRCPDCNCGGIKGAALVQGVTSAAASGDGCTSEECQLPILEEDTGSSVLE